MTKLSPQNRPTIPTIVVSRPGVMQQSLRAALAVCPGVLVVASAGDGLTALNQVVRHRPRLLVIDSNLLDEEVEALLIAVRAVAPKTCCLVCLQSPRRETRLRDLGAAAVVIRHSSAEQWQAVLLRLTQETSP